MKNIVVLISGQGTNLRAILAAAADERWDARPGARVAAVISNRSEAAGLEVARAAGLPCHVVSHTEYGSREAFDEALARTVDRYSPDLLVLAGFMRVLTPGFVRRYEGRLVNIHPSLLPLFPGLRTHRQALAAGVRVHGATVHYVSNEVDGGAIIAQAAVPVQPGDDEASLAARVLVEEHRLLPRAVRLVLEGRVRFDHDHVVLDGIGPNELSLLVP
ncbi:MAG TPA: phosphoribosylglycinamide formyltransferase [Burkholderiaceae bacterium]|nr:phosphoribosylglycinamide formyltransferase [Burkholderiaceae bacterium]